jgi:hypothetical protein
VRDRWVELAQKNDSVYDASDIPAGLKFFIFIFFKKNGICG